MDSTCTGEWTSYSNATKSSTINAIDLDDTEDDNKTYVFVLVGSKLGKDKELIGALKSYDYEWRVVESVDERVPPPAPSCPVYVLDEFGTGTPQLQWLKSAPWPVFGAPAIKHYAGAGRQRELLPLYRRGSPLYSTLLEGVVIVFTGFTTKSKLSVLRFYALSLGAIVQKDIDNRSRTDRTVVIAYKTGSEKAAIAVTFDMTVVTPEWLVYVWQHKDDANLDVLDEQLKAEYRLPTLYKLCLSFIGFSADEGVEDLAQKSGAEIVNAGELHCCSHIVIDDTNVKEFVPSEHNIQGSLDRIHIVRKEWFWTSLHVGYCVDHASYEYEQVCDGVAAPQPPATTTAAAATASPVSTKGGGGRRGKSSVSSVSTPGGTRHQNHHQQQHRRKSKVARREVLAELTQDNIDDSFLAATAHSNKKYTATAEPSLNNTGSLLDTTTESLDTDGVFLSPAPKVITSQQSQQKGKETTKSARFMIAYELLETEKNYVNLLELILKLFKDPLEDVNDKDTYQLLDGTDVNYIFGQLPRIHSVHQSLMCNLESTIQQWTNDNTQLGKLILTHIEGFKRAYPPFVNHFEDGLALIKSYAHKKPQFRFFLKRQESKKQCGKQSLQDLYTWPVQRLPRIMLLLQRILKHTDKSHPDYQLLEVALAAIKETNCTINELKRVNEGREMLFSIINGIEECPPYLLSSARSFVKRIDCTVITDYFCKSATEISMFVFNDLIEISKRRKESRASIAIPIVSSHAAGPTSPIATPRDGTATGTAATPTPATLSTYHKRFKHIKLMYFNDIIRIIDVKDRASDTCMFCLVWREAAELSSRCGSHSELGGEESSRKIHMFMLPPEPCGATGPAGGGVATAAAADTARDMARTGGAGGGYYKQQVLDTFTSLISASTCRVDQDVYRREIEADDLGINTDNPLSLSVSSGFGKAVKRFASYTSKKVGRALSISRPQHQNHHQQQQQSPVKKMKRSDSTWSMSVVSPSVLSMASSATLAGPGSTLSRRGSTAAARALAKLGLGNSPRHTLSLTPSPAKPPPHYK